MRTRIVSLLLLCSAHLAGAQTPEERTARYMESIRDHPGLLYAFLREMPKGADLHSHLSGTVYAETYIQWLSEDNGCIATSSLTALAAPCRVVADTIKADSLFRNQSLYDRVVDAWSMRNWHPEMESGHARFFSTFGKSNAAGRNRGGDMLAVAMRRAHDNRVSYLELMTTPNDGAAALGARVGWNNDLVRMRDTLRAAGLANVIAAGRTDLASMFTRQRQLMQCGTPTAERACEVVVRILYQVGRGRPPEVVYAQLLTAFELASVDSMVVGLNMVQPEDGYISMRDFPLQMRIIDYLHGLYPNVNISLHAGELAPGVVPPEGLRNHIRESVEKGHANRIGHGVAVMYEDRPFELLDIMNRRGVVVEIALSSNATILGVSGKAHPFGIYRQYGVRTVLVTDDEAVARSEMTMEWVRAVMDQGMTYAAAKRSAHNAIDAAFVTPAMRAKLKATLDARFREFETMWRRDQ